MEQGQIGFYFDQTRCSGCLTCILACKQWHSTKQDVMQWRYVKTFEHGVYPDLKVTFLSYSCCHCETPPCVFQCPASAITKRKEDGIVLVDPEKCFGGLTCGHCREVCPYAIPQFNQDQDFKMEKCNFCPDRLAQGKRPICVEACPMHALDAGDLEEMGKKYGGGRKAEGFHYFLETRPSIVLKGK